jgi:hypothetical protein
VQPEFPNLSLLISALLFAVWNAASVLWAANPYSAAHHAFTRPHDEHVGLIETDPGKVLCYRYDLVLNGFEIGGGSIRLHDPKVQSEVFKALGIGEEEAYAMIQRQSRQRRRTKKEIAEAIIIGEELRRSREST